MRVRDGDRQRIGFIRASERRLRQKKADHRLDLLLLSVSRAGHRLLDQVRSVFGDAQSEPGGREQNGAARLPELQRRARILVDEGLFDRGFRRAEALDDARHGVEERR